MWGSFLRPQALKNARAQFKAGEIDRAALTEIENAQIKLLIEKQKRAGFHAITDGRVPPQLLAPGLHVGLPGH